MPFTAPFCSTIQCRPTPLLQATVGRFTETATTCTDRLIGSCRGAFVFDVLLDRKTIGVHALCGRSEMLTLVTVSSLKIFIISLSQKSASESDRYRYRHGGNKFMNFMNFETRKSNFACEFWLFICISNEKSWHSLLIKFEFGLLDS